MLFKVCHFLYFHTSGEPPLLPERPHTMCLARIVLKHLPGRGMHTHRAMRTSRHTGCVHSPGFTVVSPTVGTYQRGVSVGGVTELPVAAVRRGGVCRELSGTSVLSQGGTSLQEGSWFSPQPLDRDRSNAGVSSQEKASWVPMAGCSQQDPLVQGLL